MRFEHQEISKYMIGNLHSGFVFPRFKIRYSVVLNLSFCLGFGFCLISRIVSGFGIRDSGFLIRFGFGIPMQLEF